MKFCGVWAHLLLFTIAGGEQRSTVPVDESNVTFQASSSRSATTPNGSQVVDKNGSLAEPSKHGTRSKNGTQKIVDKVGHGSNVPEDKSNATSNVPVDNSNATLQASSSRSATAPNSSHAVVKDGSLGDDSNSPEEDDNDDDDDEGNDVQSRADYCAEGYGTATFFWFLAYVSLVSGWKLHRDYEHRQWLRKVKQENGGFLPPLAMYQRDPNDIGLTPFGAVLFACGPLFFFLCLATYQCVAYQPDTTTEPTDDATNHTGFGVLDMFKSDGWHFRDDWASKIVMPEKLQPYYLMPLCFGMKIMFQFLAFGYSVKFEFKPETEINFTDRLKEMVKTLLKLSHIIAAVNGYHVDYLRFLEHAQNCSNNWQLCSVFMIVWVTSANYASSVALWISLKVESPMSIFNLSAKPIKATDGQRILHLSKPKYEVVNFPLPGFPLFPGTAEWLPFAKHAFALVLAPYYLPSMVFWYLSGAVLSMMCLRGPCTLIMGVWKAMCACWWSLFCTIITLGAWSWARSHLVYQLWLWLPLIELSLLVAWAQLVIPAALAYMFTCFLWITSPLPFDVKYEFWRAMHGWFLRRMENICSVLVPLWESQQAQPRLASGLTDEEQEELVRELSETTRATYERDPHSEESTQMLRKRAQEKAQDAAYAQSLLRQGVQLIEADKMMLMSINKNSMGKDFDLSGYGEIWEPKEGPPGVHRNGVFEAALINPRIGIFIAIITDMSAIIVEQAIVIFIMRALAGATTTEEYVSAAGLTMHERHAQTYFRHMTHLANATTSEAIDAVWRLV